MGARKRTKAEPKAEPKARKPRKPRKLKATTPEAPCFDWEAGTVNIWPILAADASQLAAEIEAGEHDGYLSLLEYQDRAQHGGRPIIQKACKARRKG